MKPGDEVIVPGNTFIASVLAISDNGLTPVFAEPSEKTYNLDTDKLEKYITPRTKAIMVVHLYGAACWDEKLYNIAKKYNLKVIEDNAQAIAATANFAGFSGQHNTANWLKELEHSQTTVQQKDISTHSKATTAVWTKFRQQCSV